MARGSLGEITPEQAANELIDTVHRVVKLVNDSVPHHRVERIILVGRGYNEAI